MSSNKFLAPPPEGVLAGESVPRENEKEGYDKMYDRMKKTRCRMLDRGWTNG